MLNFTNLKLKKIKVKKLGALTIFAVFTIASFLTGSSVSNAAASGTALPISFGGTGATTQAGTLTNLGINNTLDENSSNSTFPSGKTVYEFMNKAMNPGNISMDNVNFSSSITSWTGGDLIYKGSDLSSIASNNKIKVGDKACTTSGQGYTSNSAADDGIPQVGCVLPDLAVGTHAVTISTDGGASYTINAGKVIYTQTPTLSGCDTTSMQTFGANATACKASMQQGQVIVLNDTRGNSDSPNGQKYRVKKMPDGYVWMIDNLKLGSTTNTTVLTPVDTNITSNFTLSKIDNSTANSDPTSTTYCSSSGLVNTHNPGNTTGCGYLYDWYTAMAGTGNLSGYSISPKGWSLPDCAGGNSDSNICRTSEKSFLTLSNKMLTAAADSNDNRNPVYSTTDYKNFNEGGTNYPSPWLGVYAGGHDCYSTCEDKIDHQGINGYYLSSDYHYHAEYAYSWIYNNNSVNTVLLRLINGHSFRSVLY